MRTAKDKGQLQEKGLSFVRVSVFVYLQGSQKFVASTGSHLAHFLFIFNSLALTTYRFLSNGSIISCPKMRLAVAHQPHSTLTWGVAVQW